MSDTDSDKHAYLIRALEDLNRCADESRRHRERIDSLIQLLEDSSRTIQRLVRERDAARLEICKRLASVSTTEEYALARGWSYLFDSTRVARDIIRQEVSHDPE